MFWATWCVPCQRQIQLLQKGVDAGDMSLDQVKLINLGEERELVVEYINNHQVKMATYLSEADAWRKFDVVATPTILFIGKESKIEYVTTGFSPMINFRIANFLNP